MMETVHVTVQMASMGVAVQVSALYINTSSNYSTALHVVVTVPSSVHWHHHCSSHHSTKHLV